MSIEYISKQCYDLNIQKLILLHIIKLSYISIFDISIVYLPNISLLTQQVRKKEVKMKKKKLSPVLRLLIKSFLIITAGIITLLFVVEPYRMTGNEMSPYVKDGDLCIFYKLEKIHINDVVLYETDNGETKVGRVAAYSGQTIDFTDNGEYLTDGYFPAEENPYDTYVSDSSENTYPLKLDEDEVFILNDFRQLTSDSREYGPVKIEKIKGKLLFLMRRRGF